MNPQPLHTKEPSDTLASPCHLWRLDCGAEGVLFRIDFLDGVVAVVDHHGRQVWCAWTGNATLDDAATYLYGPLLAYAAYRHGFECLHASAAAIDGRAVVLAGQSGAGKSTVAAAFAVLGYPILTEDVAALDRATCPPLVQPGYPRISLWPESVEMVIGGHASQLPAITPDTPNWDKRFLALHAAGDGRPEFCAEPRPLGAVYVIGQRSETASTRIQPLHGAEALMAVAGGVYPQIIYSRRTLARDLDAFASLAQTVPVRRVVAPEDPAAIRSVCQAIIEDFAAIALTA